MDVGSRARIGLAVAVVVATVVLAALGLAAVYGFAAEYGGGAFSDLAFVVVPVPALLAALAVTVWPGLPTRTRVVVVLGTAAVVVVGGLAADALGRDAHRDRLVAESRDFTCNGPNAETTVDAAVDRTWQALPRRQPVYGPIEGSATHCVAGVHGDGEQTFADYTDAFRGLDGWRVTVDQPRRFVMTRDDVEVTVELAGAPDRLTTIGVAVSR